MNEDENKYIDKYNKKLNKYFGYKELKPEQYTIIYNIVKKSKDVCAILNTGFGKSICYQMPFLITKKNVIIVSPLISLIKEQVEQMNKLGISACLLNSECKNKSEVKNLILNGNSKIIYITPEYLVHCEDFVVELYDNNDLALIAIDEAHCVSSWGHSFRNSYLQLGCIKEWVPDVPVLAMTATASDKIKKDICSILNLNDPFVIIGKFDRPNLYLSVTNKTKSIINDIGPLIERNKNNNIIIYCLTRVDTEKVSEILNKHDYQSGIYHAGLSPKERNDVQDSFTNGSINIIVATIAFGMGINIPDIRLVIHYSCPKNLESYYQEIGRAGRDGLPSYCYMFFSQKDFSTARYFLQTINDINHKVYQEKQINYIKNYAYTSECRRKILLEKFGEKVDSCTNCDNCTKKDKTDNLFDMTEQSFLVLSLINSLDGRFGASTYVGVLRGSCAKNISFSLKKSKFYNKGSNHSEKWWKQLLHMLIQHKYIEEISFRKFGQLLSCTTSGKEWMNNKTKLMLPMTQDMIILNKPQNLTMQEVKNNIIEIENNKKNDNDNDNDNNNDNDNDNDNKKKGERKGEKKEEEKKENTLLKKNKKWTDMEESQLLGQVNTDSIKKIAAKHGRTEGAIRARLKEIAVKMFINKSPIEDITEATKVNHEQLVSYMAYKTKK